MAFASLAEVPPLQLVGLAGACTYIMNYVFITCRTITTESPVFFINNLLASSLVIISLADAFNAATAVIQVFWVAVSLWGLTTRLRGRPPRWRSSRPKPSRQADRLRSLL